MDHSLTTVPSRNRMALEDRFAIEGHSITKKYGEEFVVRSLSLAVENGTVLGLLGPNGAGKTTTIKMVMGLTPPTSGSLQVLGLDVAKSSREVRSLVGYVPEKPCVFPWMRVREVLAFARVFYPNWDDTYCTELTNICDLDPNKKVRSLSKGMAAKLSLLIALSHRPPVLVLDEPTSGLDPMIRREFLDIVQDRVQKEGLTVFFSSHIISDVEQIADTVAILNRGELLLTEPLDHFVKTTKRLRISLCDDGMRYSTPPGTLWSRRTDRTLSLTIADFDDDVREFLTSQPAVLSISAVSDMDLEPIFHDVIKGSQTRRDSTSLKRH